MLEVQKKTYLNAILSSSYSDNSFLAKSITLDFLFGFYNPYTAITTLNECLNENNCLAKMGLNCIYGILLAVKEYREFNQSAITREFIKTLINAITYKIEDVTIENYKTCMEEILEFIVENIDFKLIISFFRLADTFSFCGGENEEREEVFNKYCDALNISCQKLIGKDSKLLCYSLLSVKEELSDIDFGPNKVLNQVNDILLNIYNKDNKHKKKILVISNSQDKANELVNRIQKKKESIDISIAEKKDVNNIQSNSYLKIIFLVDVEKEDLDELLYLFGLMEGKLEKNQIFGYFYNYKKSKTELFYQTLSNRYADDSNIDDRLTKFLSDT